MLEAIETFGTSMLTVERWPFWSTVVVLTVIGQFTSFKLFTRERAYTPSRWQWVWWWGRETLTLHPLAAGFALGTVWRNPEGASWPLIASQMYFAVAGAVSLGAWSWLKGGLKKRGLDIHLPGMSEPPGKK